MIGHQPQLAEFDAPFFIQAAHSFHGPVKVDRIGVSGGAQFGNHPLRLAQRIGADQHAGIGVIGQHAQQFPDFLLDGRVDEQRQTECRLGNQDIAGGYLKRGAGRVRPALVIAGHDHALPGVFEQDLRRSQYVPGRQIGRIDAAGQPHRLAVGYGHRTVIGGIAQFHDRQRFGRRDSLPVSAARVVGMTMRDQCLVHCARGIDPAIGRRDVDAVRFGPDPGKICNHRFYSETGREPFPVRAPPSTSK